MLLVFVVVLGVGAFLNGMPKDEDPMRDAVSEMQTPGSSSVEQQQQKAALESPLIAVGTDDNFKEEVLSAKKPVLAVFYVDSDPHCTNMAPIFTSLANKFQDSLKVVKVDLMTNPTLFKKYYGQLPAMVIFKNGKQVQALAGEMTEGDLSDFLSRQHIKTAAGASTASTAPAQPVPPG
jgi:thioredoxin-like negative regulator of GroEL